ncbi:MAG TPA: PTS sugar transporter subunit IIC [Candidatus Acidoferrales bacterium]|nr:PTS sugar transporter subunit IIC [Candidatus Acidoferrales bacterium]
MVWSQIVLAGIWGGVLAVERRAFLQAMFSRPLVAATGMGLILHDLPSGLFIGMVLELFHLGSANLGAALPENETLAATGTTAAAVALASHTGGSTPAYWSMAILLFAGLGPAGRIVDHSLEAYCGRLAAKAMASAEHGELARAVRQNVWGMWPHFVVFGAATALCALFGFALAPVAASLPLRALRGLAWSYPAIASVAAAIAVRGSHARRAALYAGVAAAAVVCAVALAPWLSRVTLLGSPRP